MSEQDPEQTPPKPMGPARRGVIVFFVCALVLGGVLAGLAATGRMYGAPEDAPARTP